MHGFSSSHSLNMWETSGEAQHNRQKEKPLIIPICSERYVRHHPSSRPGPTFQQFPPCERSSEPAAAGDGQWRR